MTTGPPARASAIEALEPSPGAGAYRDRGAVGARTPYPRHVIGAGRTGVVDRDLDRDAVGSAQQPDGVEHQARGLVAAGALRGKYGALVPDHDREAVVERLCRQRPGRVGANGIRSQDA